MRVWIVAVVAAAALIGGGCGASGSSASIDTQPATSSTTMPISTTASTVPPAQCTEASVAAALEAAVGHPFTVGSVKCAGDWVIARIVAPLVDAQDGPDALQMVDGRWQPKGSMMGTCPTSIGMPIDVYNTLFDSNTGASQCVSAPSPTPVPAPPSIGCSNPQAIAGQLGADFSSHWPGAASWSQQSDFEQYAKPKIEAMAQACGKVGAEKVLEDMNVVGVTWRAFTSWAGV